MKEKSSTGENIFKLTDNEMKSKGIPWKQSICFCSDNASVMMGERKGVVAFIKQENKDVFVQGCTCHLTHIAAHNAAKKLLINAENVLTDIYYLDKSSKRNKELSEILQAFGQDD